MIYEIQNTYPINIINKTILFINIKNALEFIRGKKDMIFNRFSKEKFEFKFNWIIYFYSEKEIKTNFDRNIFIAINKNGKIYIILINVINTNKIILKDKKNNIYELIKEITINNFKPIKITKFEKLFKPKEKDNYFIINSMKSINDGKAIIINAIENNNYIDIKDKYNIEIIQIIKDINGLYSSIEFLYIYLIFIIIFIYGIIILKQTKLNKIL